MTSSGHTGERAIHSSDFSAFTKRLHRPSLLRFLTQLLPLRLSIALRRLPQWNFVLLAVKCHGISPLYATVFFPGAHRAPTRRLVREAAASRRAASWGSDVELEEMESEQTGLAFSLPPSPDRARANSPVEFLPDFQFPSPKARDFVSFGLDDILHTAASDSEDFGPASADALPPNGQEARPTPSSWTCFRAPPKSLRWIGPMSPASLELQSSTIASSSARIPSLKGGSCHFSVICIARSPVPGSSHFPLALLTRQPLTSPTLWVLWSRVTPPCR